MRLYQGNVSDRDSVDIVSLWVREIVNADV